MDWTTTREFMWNIPTSFTITMYVGLIISLVVMVKGLLGKVQLITNGKSVKELLPEQLNWSSFFKTIFFAGKVPRFKKIGLIHALIFYGFWILFIATDLAAVHIDTPFKIFRGPVYIVISFLADFAGLAVLIGIALAYKRRYIEKPDYLSATKPKNELFMYWMLAGLVILGFLLEGVRIYGTDAMDQETFISPIGHLIGLFIGSLGLSNEALANIFKSVWMVHMIHTMVFVASIGHSKFSHILFLPFSSLITPARRGAVLNPMNFEDETAETFGLGKLSELTMKQRFDTQVCVECGRCTQVCPANQADKLLNPKTIITKARDFLEETTSAGQTDGDFWEKELYASNELDACTTCGACMEECPANIEHVSLIMDLKRYKALTLGDLPPDAANAINNIRVNGNPWGISQDDRFKWADGLDVPVIEAGKKVDFLYYIGCAGNYDDSNQTVTKDVISLLKKAGVSFAVMGKMEKCNGDPIRRFGDEYSFYEVAIENIANIRQYDFDKIVTHCPHCLHTIGKEYGKFDDGDFTVVHHTELLHDLIKSGKLKPSKAVNEEMTYHDPCYLGRHHGEYDAPREILGAIPGVSVKEMERNKDTSLCCGMGGGNMWYELPEGKHLAVNRLDDIAQTNVQKLAASCSYCIINFNSSRGQNEKTENLVVEDVASILAKSVE